MTIYLYKKTHNKTGLQYLGKTKSTKKSKEKLDTPKKVCYYCNKSIDAMNYARWHGDNCKLKGNI